VNFEGATLLFARLETADLSGANCTDTVLDRANLRGTIFDGANLTDASFTGADVSNASFRDARLQGADLTGITGASTADFAGACGSLTTRLPENMSLPMCEGALVADLD
jgi:uncharacterized protein YjbI with pentapeptide repeats